MPIAAVQPSLAVVYVTDDVPARTAFAASFGDEFRVLTPDPAEAVALISGEPCAVLVADLPTGEAICSEVGARFPHVGRVLVVSWAEQDQAEDAVRRGLAERWLGRPWVPSEVAQALRDQLARLALERVVRELRGRMAEKDRVAGLAAVGERMVYELANVTTSVQSNIDHIEAIVDGVAARLPRDAVGELRAELRDLGDASRYLVDLYREAVARRRKSKRLRVAMTELAPVLRLAADLVAMDLAGVSRLSIECPPGARVWADRTAIARIVANLLVNACQALSDAGRDDGEVTIRVIERADAVEIEVIDDGPGVPSEIRGRLFEPLFTTRGARGGSGLGLAISRELAKGSGGSLDHRDTEAPGATFVLRLPRAAPATLRMASGEE